MGQREENRFGVFYTGRVRRDVHIVYQNCPAAAAAATGREEIITISLIDIDRRPAVERV